MAQNQPKLIYFGDPMCSWCYGFSPEFSKAAEALDDQVEVQFVMGGLRPYNTETMTDLSDFLRYHWEEVSQRSGQPFQYDILSSEEIMYDTEPSCRAVVTIRHMQPESEFAFFKATQRGFYFDNNNPNTTATFVELAEKMGVDGSEFQRLFESDEMKKAVREDFLRSQEMGVRGFPTVLLKNGDQLYMLSNGYTTAEKLIARANDALKN